jgi:hypothetical protein
MSLPECSFGRSVVSLQRRGPIPGTVGGVVTGVLAGRTRESWMVVSIEGWCPVVRAQFTDSEVRVPGPASSGDRVASKAGIAVFPAVAATFWAASLLAGAVRRHWPPNNAALALVSQLPE